MVIKISPQARADIRAAHAWWRANRPAAPYLLRDELRQAFLLLPEHPRIGTTAANEAPREIRRLFLRGTRYFIYYSVRTEDVEILRLWHASRGAKPKL